MRTRLSYLESKIRVLLLGFCVYSFIYAIVFNLLPKFAESIVHNYIFIILASIFSFFAGFIVDEEIEITKQLYEWDWIVESKSDYICAEFVGLVSIGAFYFAVQMGICMIFFPEFDKVQFWGDRYLYPYVFTFNSIMIYILYRLTIIKIVLIKTTHKS